MNKLDKLFIEVNNAVNQATDRYKKSNDEYIKTSETSRTSWSAAGERDYSEGQTEINRRNLESLVKLKSEIEESMKNNESSQGMYFKYKDVELGIENEIFVVENVVNISGFNLVSKSSPFGVAILSSKSKFEIGGKKYKLLK